MGRTGSQNTDRTIIEAIAQALGQRLFLRSNVENGSIPYPLFLKTYDSLRAAIEKVVNSRRLRLHVLAEQTIVDFDLANFAFFSSAERSLAAAADQLADLERLLAYRDEDSALYHAMSVKIVDPREFAGDLPKDGIRKLIGSHLKRIDNMLTDASGRSSYEISYMRARRNMVSGMERLYREMQEKGLGLA